MHRLFAVVSLALVLVSLSAAQDPPAQTAKPAPEATSQPTTAAKDQNPFAAFKQFSATMQGGLIVEETTKVYRSGDLVRLESGESYRLTNMKAGNTRVIEGKECHKFAHPDIGSYLFASPQGLTLERVPTDEKDTFDGHPCKIAHVSVKNGENEVANWKLWEAEDLKGFPVKVEITRAHGKDTKTFQFKDVSLQPPSAALFKIPKQCTAVTGKTVVAPPKSGQKGTGKAPAPGDLPNDPPSNPDK